MMGELILYAVLAVAALVLMAITFVMLRGE